MDFIDIVKMSIEMNRTRAAELKARRDAAQKELDDHRGDLLKAGDYNAIRSLMWTVGRLDMEMNEKLKSAKWSEDGMNRILESEKVASN